MGHQELSYDDIRDKKIKYKDIRYEVVINPSYEWLGDVESSGISHRELEVLALAMEGCNNREVAEILQIKDQSVKNHMHNLKKKMGVKNSSQVVLIALSMNLIKWRIICDYFNIELNAHSFLEGHKVLLGGRHWSSSIRLKSQRDEDDELLSQGIDVDEIDES